MRQGTWRDDYSEHKAREKKNAVLAALTADLPINSAVAITTVDDPLSVTGGKLDAVRSVRDDPLAGMHARRQIDDAQFAAGRLWQRYHEMSEIGPIQAIDPGKEAVDGGKMREPITDRQREAFKALDEARGALSATAWSLVSDVLGKRVGIRQAAEARGRFTSYGWKQTGAEFRDALEVLAVLWGLAAKAS